jgi:formylglycine-generating enzyme required for sulfatase activity
MKTVINMLAILLIVSPITAQEIIVNSFSERIGDLSASKQIRMDNNGILCALVKVLVHESDVQFEPNVIGNIPHIENEYWVYLPAGSKHLKVRHPNYLTTDVLFEDYGVKTLVSGITYELELDLPAASSSELYGGLNITTKPDMSNVYIDGVAMGDTPLFLQQPIGEHKLLITHENYEDLETTILIDVDQISEIAGTLHPKANVKLWCNAMDAQVYVDGVLKGSLSNNSFLISYGHHTIVLKDENYFDYTTDIEVTSTTKLFTFTMRAKNRAPKTFTVKGVSFKMIQVDGGTYIMGIPKDNIKKRQVTLSNYYIGETEVTQELWQAVMGNNPSSFNGANRPVDNISWYDCQTFIKKLNILTGQNFRLPTEAEWEYAARGGNNSRGYQYAGSDNLNGIAWYDRNSGNQTHNVKGKLPNEIGLYDMSGNVWEWCQDWREFFSDQFDDEDLIPVLNPVVDIRPSGGEVVRVYRGGSYNTSREYCPSVNRMNPSAMNNIGRGLRLAL